MAGTETGVPVRNPIKPDAPKPVKQWLDANCSRFKDMTLAMIMALMRRCRNTSLTSRGGPGLIAAGVLERNRRMAISHGANSIVSRHKDSRVDQTAAGNFHDLNGSIDGSGVEPSSNLSAMPAIAVAVQVMSRSAP